MPNSHAHFTPIIGTPSGDLTVDWWLWAADLPDDPNVVDNAFQDTTGEFARQGDVGDDLFFLAGLEMSGEVHRSFAVPEGSTIVVPLLTAGGALPIFGEHTPADEAESLSTLQGFLAGFVASAANVYLKIDGETIISGDPDGTPGSNAALHFVDSPEFSFGAFHASADVETRGYQSGYFTDINSNQPSIEGVELAPADAIGWWATISNLLPGHHVIEFGGVSTDDGTPEGNPLFDIAIVDEIWVLPENAYDLFNDAYDLFNGHTVIA